MRQNHSHSQLSTPDAHLSPRHATENAGPKGDFPTLTHPVAATPCADRDPYSISLV